MEVVEIPHKPCNISVYCGDKRTLKGGKETGVAPRTEMCSGYAIAALYEVFVLFLKQSEAATNYSTVSYKHRSKFPHSWKNSQYSVNNQPPEHDCMTVTHLSAIKREALVL